MARVWQVGHHLRGVQIKKCKGEGCSFSKDLVVEHLWQLFIFTVKGNSVAWNGNAVTLLKI